MKDVAHWMTYYLIEHVKMIGAFLDKFFSVPFCTANFTNNITKTKRKPLKLNELLN